MHISTFKKPFILLAVSALFLAACSSGETADGNEAYAGPVGDTTGTINILAWPGYAEDGSTDPNVD